MSYSFSTRGANKAEAKANVVAEMAKVISGQRCHSRDAVTHCNAANAIIDQLADDDSKDVAVSMSGSLMGQWAGSDVVRCEGASVSVSASLAPRAAP